MGIRDSQYDPTILRAKGGRELRFACDGASELRMEWIAAVLRERLGVNPAPSLILRIALHHFVDYLGAQLDALGDESAPATGCIQLAIYDATGAKYPRIPEAVALESPVRPLHPTVREWEAKQPHRLKIDEATRLKVARMTLFTRRVSGASRASDAYHRPPSASDASRAKQSPALAATPSAIGRALLVALERHMAEQEATGGPPPDTPDSKRKR